MSDIKQELWKISDDFSSHMRLLDILRSEGEDTGPLEKTIAAYFTHDVTRDKIDSVIGYIRYCDEMERAAQVEGNRLQDLAKSYKTQLEWLKDCAKGVLEMSGEKRLEGLTAGSLTLQKAGGRQAVTITKASLVPEELVTYQGTISGEAWSVLLRYHKGHEMEPWFVRQDVQMERIPHKGRIGEALSQKCSRCDGNGVVEASLELDHLVDGEIPCKACDGSGLQRVPGCRLEPRGSSVVLR